MRSVIQWYCSLTIRAITVACLLFVPANLALPQTATGDILGTVLDPAGAVVPDARVTAKNLATNISRETNTGSDGNFRISLLPAGDYEVTVEKPGFARYVQGPITLRLNQAADLRIAMTIAAAAETIRVEAGAPLINTTNAEISTSFEAKRISELPLSTNRNLLNIAASIPGVAGMSAGNSNFGSSGNQGTESGLNYSANGMRQRSNSFLIDGQDSWYPSTGGLLQPVNNPDIISEVRVITNQFLPEYGRTGGSVMSVITKSGSNDFHGSLFWFHNSNHFNALTNAEKRIVPTPARALFRIENQFGGTLGGPVIKDKTFFFVSLLRWTDRRLGAGSAINGAPTEAGRQLLQSIAANRPTVRALLENLPAGAPNGQTRTVTADGRTLVIPLGDVTGAGSQAFNDWQYSYRADHRFNDRHSIAARYMDDDSASTGTGQLTPAGLTNVSPLKVRSASVNFTSAFTPRTLNEFRTSFSRYQSATNAANPAVAERIPSIEVPDLGLRGFNAATTRTAIGLAVNLPQFATLNNYQIQDGFTMIRGQHNFKFGFDFRRQEQFQFFLPTIRGRLEYATLQRLVDDQATVAQVNTPLRGGSLITYFRYYDYFFYLQDEWRIRPNLTVTYGVRYETPGNPVQNLVDLNKRIVAANNNDPRYQYFYVPNRDRNNWAPRLGLNYRFGKGSGLLGWITGDQKLVLRAGYSRTYDVGFNNIPLNIASSFPMVAAFDIPTDSTGVRPNAYGQIGTIIAGNIPTIANPDALTRTIVSPSYRSPFAEQISVQLQRELGRNWVFSTGYIGTKGTALFQSIDGNPTLPTAPGVVRTTRTFATRGVIRERCNCTSSTYHSLQTSLEKRLSANFTMAAHYTWSSFIDGASEVFNPSTVGEIAFSQDPYDRRSERARSTYDRPHRFTINGVFGLPFFRQQEGVIGKILGGWQANGFLTLQSGAPFGPLNGSDPGGVLSGNLVGTSTRPFLNTNLNLSSMTVREIQAAGGRSLFTPATVFAPIGNAGRNIFRADGINRIDFGILKNIRVREGHNFQIHANFFNLTNTRDWGIPEGVITSSAFLNEGAFEVPARRIQMGLRYSF
jgi:hypothetical protein